MARYVRILDDDEYIDSRMAEVGRSGVMQTTDEVEEFDTTQMAADERELIRLYDSRSLDEELQQLRALASSIKLKLAGIETANDALTSILSEYGVDLNDRRAVSFILGDYGEADDEFDDEMSALAEKCTMVEFAGCSIMMDSLDQSKQSYFDATAYVMMATIAPTGSALSEDCYDRAVDILDQLADFANHVHSEVMLDDNDVKECDRFLAAKSAVLLYVVTGYEADVLRQRLTRYDQRAAELEKAINKSQ